MVESKNITIVGTNNTTRSFMAEAIFRRLCEEHETEELTVISRGLVVLFPEPVNPKAAQAVGKAGYKIREFQATKLMPYEVEEANLIITITPEEKERVLTDYADYIKDTARVLTLSELAEEQIGISNPYGKETEDYDLCFLTIKRMCEKCYKKILQLTQE